MGDINSTSASGSQSWSTETAPTNTGDGNNGSDHGIVSRVRERAAAELSTQKNLAFDGIGSVAQAVRQSTQHLREQQHDTLAGYVEQAADEIERFAQQLRGKDLNELFDDAQQMARRQPAVFIGSAFALGLIGARFFKSTPQARHNSQYSSGAYRRDRNEIAGRRNPAPTPSVNRSTQPSMDSPSMSSSRRDTGWDDLSASPIRTTADTAGKPLPSGASASPSANRVGSSESAARSRRVDSSVRDRHD